MHWVVDSDVLVGVSNALAVDSNMYAKVCI